MFMPIQCDWCGQPIKGGSFQVIASKGIQAIGARRAIFHPRCGAAVISICETGLAPKTQAQNAEKPAAAKTPAKLAEEPVVKPARRRGAWRLPPRTERAVPDFIPQPPSAPPKVQKREKLEANRSRLDIRKPQADPKPERPPVDRSRVLDLQSRGFRPNQIAAQLRASYAEVNRIIEEAA